MYVCAFLSLSVFAGVCVCVCSYVRTCNYVRMHACAYIMYVYMCIVLHAERVSVYWFGLKA